MRFAVIGAGSWGTTVAALLCDNGYEVLLWAREREVVEEINKSNTNPYFMKNMVLPKSLRATGSLEEALEFAQCAVTAIPSSFLAKVLKSNGPQLKRLDAIVNLAKGFEPESGRRLSEVLCNIMKISPESQEDKIAAISGPNLAPEVAQKKLGACVIACPDKPTAQKLQKCFATDYFRVYRVTDRTGVELGGALKNVFAIGAGIVNGLGLGDNAKAAYLTRSLHELVRLGTALGGQFETFYGLAGLGDLNATTSSGLSRNYRLGNALAKGKSHKDFTESINMVVEGVETAKTAMILGKKLTIELPITEELCRVLFENHPPEKAAKNLMNRSLKAENE